MTTTTTYGNAQRIEAQRPAATWPTVYIGGSAEDAPCAGRMAG